MGGLTALSHDRGQGRSEPARLLTMAARTANAGRASGERCPPEDNRDVRRCLDGDGDAFRGLIQRHQARVSRMMWRFSRDPDVHEELVGDVFVEAFRSLRGFRATAPFEHWLARIATRVGYRHWKRRKREGRIQTVPLEEWDGVPSPSPEELEPAEAAEILHTLLAELPPRDRLVITLRYVENHSVATTAQLTGWSKAMVKVQAHRARAKLRRLFAQARQEAER